MSINYAILGILSYKSMTGYDIKKIVQDSNFMHWSGNNNQIYKALTELLNTGLVNNEVKHQEGSPTKKIYIITDEGLAALKEWILSPSEPSEIKKPFLIRLAWSKQLNSRELNRFIDEYENQVKIQLLMEERKIQDKIFLPDRTNLEKTIWTFVNDNILRTHKNELLWIKDLRVAIAKIPNENDFTEDLDVSVVKKEKIDRKVKYAIKNNNEISYIHLNDSKAKLETEKDILDIITALAENNTQLVLFDIKSLSKDFLEVKKGLLGSMLQKFTMYHINSAIVVKDKNILNNEFSNAIAESRNHDILRLFENVEDAEKWFLSLKRMEKMK